MHTLILVLIWIASFIAVWSVFQALTPFVAMHAVNPLTRLLWAVWGNDEDPLPPSSFLPGIGQRWRILRWYFRNMGHNLTWHVLGVAGQQYERVGRYHDQVWNPDGGWNWAMIVQPPSIKLLTIYAIIIAALIYADFGTVTNVLIGIALVLRLFMPFVSHRGERREWYLGWRERGALGAAFRRAKST